MNRRTLLDSRLLCRLRGHDSVLGIEEQRALMAGREATVECRRCGERSTYRVGYNPRPVGRKHWMVSLEP